MHEKNLEDFHADGGTNLLRRPNAPRHVGRHQERLYRVHRCHDSQELHAVVLLSFIFTEDFLACVKQYRRLEW
jgi:hypothetical protein